LQLFYLINKMVKINQPTLSKIISARLPSAEDQVISF